MAHNTWFSRRAIGLHVLILIVVPTFAALCIWQVHRALGGNDLSWAYVFEWPFFAGYAIYMWWRFVHEAPDATTPDPAIKAEVSAPLEAAPAEPTPASPDDDPHDLEAYNAYLAELATQDQRRQHR